MPNLTVINNLAQNAQNIQGSVSSSGQSSALPQNGFPGTNIIIHVCDENKKMNKDFRCDK